ncbi:hypothetical protein NTG1052_610002 [Candidatus Nitrotoga sp. 1052]|nr:hypothetical protein NTG1052_610002 [Candidatus Nitrotoga sp. 1052]
MEPGLSLCAFVNGVVGGGAILDIPSQGLVEIELYPASYYDLKVDYEALDKRSR